MKNLLDKMRIDHWWGSFISFIMSLVYLYIMIFDIQFNGRSFLLIIFSLLTTIGFVSFGYLINEIFDIKDDIKAGKPNRLFGTSKKTIAFYLIGSLILVFLPWLYLPSSYKTWWLIGGELVLFLLYSMPFPKLKKIPVLSTLVDTAYAYIFPPVLAFITYASWANHTMELYSFAYLLIWLFIVGFRNIFIHQIDDISYDKASGIRTLPMIIGITFSNVLLIGSIIVEPVIFILAIDTLVQINPITYIATIALFMITLNSIVTNEEPYQGKFFAISTFRNLYDPFYQAFWPIILIIGLAVFYDVHWLWLLLVHFTLFIQNTQAIYQRLKSWYQWTHSGLKNAMYKLGHYSISHILLIFGVNLKERNMSVLDYFNQVLGRK